MQKKIPFGLRILNKNHLQFCYVYHLFSVDLNNDGEPDLKQIRKFTANIFGIKYPVGKLFLELIKTAVTIFVIYLSVVFITRYTDLM